MDESRPVAEASVVSPIARPKGIGTAGLILGTPDLRVAAALDPVNAGSEPPRMRPARLPDAVSPPRVLTQTFGAAPSAQRRKRRTGGIYGSCLI